MNHKNSITKIHTRYKNFQKEQRDIWESFCLIDFYAPKIKQAIKEDIFPVLEFEKVWDGSNKTLKKDDTYGALSSLSSKGNFRRTLLETVLTFENYITDLVETVYIDFPGKLNQKQNENDSDATKYSKLMNLIIKSDNKQDMVNILIEEKIRSIFYGNPLDIFEKDKVKLEFGTYFKDKHKKELTDFKSIIAIRNLLIHNNGIVDRKYIKESDKNTKLGTKVIIDKKFLKNSIYTLSLLAAHSTRIVIENVYNQKPQGNLAKAISTFN